MTVLLLAIDGLDYRWVNERERLDGLGAKRLHQDLEGPNGLYTLRVWPAIWCGEDGGASEQNPYERSEPDAAPLWEKYSTSHIQTPHLSTEKIMRNQRAFHDGYLEQINPASRVDDMFNTMLDSIDQAEEDGYDVQIIGTQILDRAGHFQRDDELLDSLFDKTMTFAEAACEKADEWLVTSDHGFDYYTHKDDFKGNRAGSIEQHTEHATLASSFADDYDTMSAFIDGWHEDLDAAVRGERLQQLGYVE